MTKIEKVKDDLGKAMPLRITWRKKRPLGKRGAFVSPSMRIKCGCCPESVVIYYDNSSRDDLEINGVNGTINQWRKVFLPLLRVKKSS
ncbi:MAG TPA: hypothetical protein VJC04_03100 [Candidatus Paceibacterota bacterium]